MEDFTLDKIGRKKYKATQVDPMYCEHFGFREKPFSMTPDPRFIFLSRHHREAFAHLLYGIDNRTGFIALTGEVGAGKTTVLRTLLAQLDPGRYCTALIFNPSPSPAELLRSINREFNIPAGGDDPARLLDALNEFLLEQNRNGKTVVLVIDEAQHLGPAVLEQVRLISNLETDRSKLIQIVLAGQPELGRMLSREELRQLDQRIAVRYHLRPMDFDDTAGYIAHRLGVVDGKGKAQFTRWALRLIYRYSGGLPRLINVVCDRALLAAYTQDTDRITAGVAWKAITDVRKDTVRPAWKPATGLGLAVVVFIALVFIYLAGSGFTERSREIPATQPAAKPWVKAPSDPSRPIAGALKDVSSRESARAAFDALAEVWKVELAPDGDDLSQAQALESAARKRGLSLLRFSGNLGALLRLDSPALLELNIPGAQGKRFIALTGVKGDLLQTRPAIAGKEWISPVELEHYWTGQGFVPWKNTMNLPSLGTGSTGESVRHLQGLLAESKLYGGPATGVYDRDTLSAVRAFQAANGLGPDGVAGQRTLILLYHSIARFQTPGLNR